MSWKDEVRTRNTGGEDTPNEYRIDPANHDFILDIVYFAARKLKGLNLRGVHAKLLEEYEPTLKRQAMRGFHDMNVQTHANVRDEDTDKRDEKWYSEDRLHSLDNEKKGDKMNWKNILKEEEFITEGNLEIVDDESIDEYKWYVNGWAKQADAINTYQDMHKLFKEMKEELDEYVFQLKEMQKPQPKDVFSDKEARPEFAREVDNQRL